MSAGSRDAITIKEDGWRQGSALPAQLVDALLREGLLPWASAPDDVFTKKENLRTDAPRPRGGHIRNMFGRRRYHRTPFRSGIVAA